MRSMGHVRYLTETIGPRGTTTPQEKAASEYAVQVFVQAGLEPVTEAFVSARSGWYPSVLFSGLILLSELLFLLGGGGGAIAVVIVSVLTLLSVMLELSSGDGPKHYFGLIGFHGKYKRLNIHILFFWANEMGFHDFLS